MTAVPPPVPPEIERQCPGQCADDCERCASGVWELLCNECRSYLAQDAEVATDG